jgi:uncharacterized membrane protein YhaH (DUF805 family)
MSSTKFFIIFILAMIPTYIYRWIFFAGNVAAFTNPAMRGRANQGFLDSMELMFYFLMLVSYITMIYVSYKRGEDIGKSFLIAFPIVAAVFDLILDFVPFVPTIFNILTIVFALIASTTKVDFDAPRSTIDSTKHNTEPQNQSASPSNLIKINTELPKKSVNLKPNEFNGERSLTNDAYKIFLSKKYNIKRNDLFNKFEVNNSKLFETLDEALFFTFNEEFKLFDEQDELLKLDNLTQAEETIKNNLTESQWEEAIVSSKKMGKTIVQWREIADQLMDELSITYINKEYCIGGLNYGYLHDAVNHAKSAKVKNAKCPNCDSLVNMLDKECTKCKASFEEMSTYRPKPI